MITITDKTPLCDVLTLAAGKAKGKHMLYDKETGKRCLWGEVYSLVGLPDTAMQGKGHLSGREHVPGYEDWDQNRKGQGLARAIMEKGGMTVGELRFWLRRQDLPLQDLEEPLPLVAA